MSICTRLRPAGFWLLLVWGGFPMLSQAQETVSVASVVFSLIDDVSVASQDAGIVSQVDVHEGDQVEAGQILGKLEDAEARFDRQTLLVELQIAQREAASRLGIQLAEKSLAVAEAELRRAEQSNIRYADTVSQSEIDKLKFLRDEASLQIQHAREKIELAELRVLQKQTELEAADRRLDRRRIPSPLKGIVVKIDRQPGEWIPPGEPFCRIIRVDRLRAEGFVSQQDPRPVPGQPVEVRLKDHRGDIRSYRGAVSFVDPEINPITGQYRIWAQIENEDGHLRPGERPELLIPMVAPSGNNDSAGSKAPHSATADSKAVP